MLYRQKLIVYVLCMLFLVNHSILAISINDFLDEEVNNTNINQKIGNSLLLEKEEERNINRGKTITWQPHPQKESEKEDKWKERAPPWTPPAGYLEDPVDAVTNYHSPADNGTINDWSQMQVADGTYSNLTESVYRANLTTS